MAAPEVPRQRVLESTLPAEFDISEHKEHCSSSAAIVAADICPGDPPFSHSLDQSGDSLAAGL